MLADDNFTEGDTEKPRTVVRPFFGGGSSPRLNCYSGQETAASRQTADDITYDQNNATRVNPHDALAYRGDHGEQGFNPNQFGGAPTGGLAGSQDSRGSPLALILTSESEQTEDEVKPDEDENAYMARGTDNLRQYSLRCNLFRDIV